MSHTPEPWSWISANDKAWRIEANRGECIAVNGDSYEAWGLQNEHEANGIRIVDCINGCAGLNPAAYRACVEALEAARIFLPQDSDVMRQADEAIKHAQEPTT